MSAISISSAVRKALFAELEGSINGLLAESCAALEMEPIQFDFHPSSTKGQVWSVNTTPAALEDVDITSYPMLLIYTLGARNTNREKYRVFSGEVDFAIDVHLAWESPRASRDMEGPADAVEAAMVNFFNAGDRWSAHALGWNGLLAFERGPLDITEDGGEHWLCELRVRGTFRVNA